MILIQKVSYFSSRILEKPETLFQSLFDTHLLYPISENARKKEQQTLFLLIH
jgi:hypothetical protein